MDVVHPRCCGLDVHKQTVVACLLISCPTSQPHKRWNRAMVFSE